MLEAGSLPYDHLILATGATVLQQDQWSQLAPGLKTVEDALEIRRRVFLATGRRAQPDPRKQRQWLTFVVVGGGAASVELAGALAGSGCTPGHDFRSIDPTGAVLLLRAATGSSAGSPAVGGGAAASAA